jgi:hypothetical protein
MGRLTEYFGESKKNRSAFTTARAGDRNGDVEVIGSQQLADAIGSIMTTDPDMAGLIRKLIRKLLRDARNRLSKDAKSYMDSDPRRAARAVKFAVYKKMFGGNLSILQKRAGSAGSKYELVRQRKVEQNPTMRGGNRRPRVDDGRNRLDYYYGADRGFILRFIGSGTVPRLSRFGNRGSITQSNWFGHTAPWQMQSAADELAEAIEEYVTQQTNG